jgi:hypothetical protein
MKATWFFFSMPKALKAYFIAVFGPQAGQKLHTINIFVPLAE